jgi:hydrogenase/urease accessory protein HupE
MSLRYAEGGRHHEGATKATRTRLAGLAFVAFAATWLVALPASAHAVGLSSGEYAARGTSMTARLAFARGEVASLAPSVDDNRDGHVTAVEVEAARPLLKDKVLGRIVVTRGGAACAPALTDAGLTEQDGLMLSARWDCPNAAAGAPFAVDVALLDDLARGHRHVARIVAGGTTRDDVLYGDHRRFEVAAANGGPDPAAKGSAAAPAPEETGPWAFFKMGIEHILTGYDHLVFILGLVLARARLRALLSVITAFTVAHSITLALAVLGVWAPSSRIVEPAIALSIAYVGVENFFVKDASKRWRITFPFGLIHGFGFAGALREIALPRSAVPGALVSFNLGVEAGQLAVLGVLLPLLFLLRGRTWFEPLGVRLVSGAVAVAGGIWFVARVAAG